MHGEEEALKAKKTAEELFSNKRISDNMPSITFSKNILDINIVQLLIEANLVSSKSEAKRLIEQNGISLNQEKVTSIEKMITFNDLNNDVLVLQKGKKNFLKVIFE